MNNVVLHRVVHKIPYGEIPYGDVVAVRLSRVILPFRRRERHQLSMEVNVVLAMSIT